MKGHNRDRVARDIPARFGKTGATIWKRERLMPEADRGNRPLSPHITIYRPQLTSITSILTRITGNALLLGALMTVWWFLSAATSPEYFAFTDGLITSFLGDLIMSLSLWALWYHALAGLRHLYWDTGRGLDIDDAEKLGVAVIVLSVAMTVITLLVVGG